MCVGGGGKEPHGCEGLDKNFGFSSKGKPLKGPKERNYAIQFMYF